MRLSRRDALAALTGAGIVSGGAAATLARDQSPDANPDRVPELDADTVLDEETLATLVAAAEVVFPSDVSGITAFVYPYVTGKAGERPAFRDGVDAATTTLETYADLWRDASFTALGPAGRDGLLREMGVHTADPVPDGTHPERVRFYVVNELLYALYASPTGGDLVGIENPQGHPGGTVSYTQGPGGRR
ncbi:gluconate 2-dehydrogenase subunit 3 family protein [Salinirubellus salinus]|uniref:Gluconate 2-dehydrogenase subunit 3 family protein n=1 Tax=Salinirubellus salinus TaxID=1364945 RepID=A0A9E7U5T2_9EURY|nr:gluconate 2-dehydrogenase subunit 3 family protein [Salinirubellus salinus]UWM55755.1 gluconate 2-dehydrogenase subunit 3 family protein [Salinirubellus salinus]